MTEIRFARHIGIHLVPPSPPQNAPAHALTTSKVVTSHKAPIPERRRDDEKSGSSPLLHKTESTDEYRSCESTDAEYSACPIVLAGFCRVLKCDPECLVYACEGSMKKHIVLRGADLDSKQAIKGEDISNLDIKHAIWKLYPIGQKHGSMIHPFWQFYYTAKVACGKPSHSTYENLKAILTQDLECDFFAYFHQDPPPSKAAGPWKQAERLQESRDISPEGNKKVVMCEMKASNAYDHAAAQLELRMAAYLVHRRVKTGRRDLF